MSITESVADEESYNFENCPPVRLEGIVRRQTTDLSNGKQPIRINKTNNDLTHFHKMSRSDEKFAMRKSLHAKSLEAKQLHEVNKITMPLTLPPPIEVEPVNLKVNLELPSASMLISDGPVKPDAKQSIS